MCPRGTDGKRCETAPERCIGSPCMHGGFCRDFGSGLNCSCPAGYSGVGCQHEFDACREGACQNGASCVQHEDPTGGAPVNKIVRIHVDFAAF